MKMIKSMIWHDLSLFVYYLGFMTDVLVVGFVCLSGVCHLLLHASQGWLYDPQCHYLVHSINVRTVSSQVLLCMYILLLPGWFRVEIKCIVHLALPKRPINQLTGTESLLSQSRFAVRNNKKSSCPVSSLGNRGHLKDMNDSKLILYESK